MRNHFPLVLRHVRSLLRIPCRKIARIHSLFVPLLVFLKCYAGSLMRKPRSSILCIEVRCAFSITLTHDVVAHADRVTAIQVAEELRVAFCSSARPNRTGVSLRSLHHATPLAERTFLPTPHDATAVRSVRTELYLTISSFHSRTLRSALLCHTVSRSPYLTCKRCALCRFPISARSILYRPPLHFAAHTCRRSHA